MIYEDFDEDFDHENKKWNRNAHLLKKIVMKNFIMNQDFTTQNPKSPLFQGHDLKVFPNELLTCPE